MRLPALVGHGAKRQPVKPTDGGKAAHLPHRATDGVEDSPKEAPQRRRHNDQRRQRRQRRGGQRAAAGPGCQCKPPQAAGGARRRTRRLGTEATDERREAPPRRAAASGGGSGANEAGEPHRGRAQRWRRQQRGRGRAATTAAGDCEVPPQEDGGSWQARRRRGRGHTW